MTYSPESAKPSDDGVTLRPMAPADLAAAHALSTALHWPHRLVDWEFLVRLGEGLVAQRDGHIVGTALRWRWGAEHATVGLLIVAPHCQGRRIGQRLMRGLLDEFGSRSVLLHATAAGRGLYERLGFVASAEIRQHQGRAVQAPLVALKPDERVRPMSRRDLERLVALDGAACGMKRDALLRVLISTGNTVVLDCDGQAQGFAVLRRFGRGQAIGPVVAPDVAGAQALIAHWVNLSVGKFVRIDVDFADGLTDWLESLGMLRAGGATAMLQGPALQRSAQTRPFALVNQALG